MIITTPEMEIALAREFNYNQNLIVPCVGDGFGVHECDLLILTNHNYATEIEIKVSIADLKADFKKRHKHKSKRIKNLWFAVPIYLFDKALPFIPEKAGIITVEKYQKAGRHWYTRKQFSGLFFRCKRARKPEINTEAVRLSEKDRLKLGHLAAMRIWNLKRRIINHNKDKQMKLL